jgi:hypothetical protein
MKKEKKQLTVDELLKSGMIGSIKKGTNIYKEIDRLGSVEFSRRLAEETFGAYAAIRAVKVLGKGLKDQAKKQGFKANDIVLVERSEYGKYKLTKIEGSIVEWQRKNGLVVKR